MKAFLLFPAWILFSHVSSFPSIVSSHEGSLFFQNPVSRREIFARPGGNVVLECAAGGSPSPFLRWFRRGYQIDQGQSNFDDAVSSYQRLFSGKTPGSPPSTAALPVIDISLTESRLFLDCVSASDVGAYTCVAETLNKRISTDILLHIESSSQLPVESQCRKKRFVEDVPARIYLWTMQSLQLEGSDTQLFCRAFGNPAPKITWFDPANQEINDRSNRQYKILQNGDLLIKNVNWAENMGIFRCVAENGAGADETTAFIYPTLNA